MYRLVCFALLGLMVLGGCGGEEPPPPPPTQPELPPEPTTEEIYGQLREAVSQLFTTAQAPGGDMNEAAKSQAVTKLQSLKARHTTSLNGPQALRQIQDEIEALITKMRDAQRWQTLKTCIEFFKVFDPSSDKYLPLIEKADLMLARPTVSVKGFFELSDGLYAFLEVKDKQTNKIENYKVREGEELHNGVLRLVRIIGNKQSIEIEYTPINTTWVVEGPRQ